MEDGVRKVSTSQENSNCEIVVQRQINLRPIIFMMGLSGCYSFQKPRWKATEVCLWIYNLLLLVSCLFFTGRFFAVMKTWPSIAIYIFAIMLGLEGTFNLLVSWKSFSKHRGYFHTFVDKIHEIVTEMYENNMNIDYCYISKRQILCVMVAVLLIVTDLSIQLVVAYVFVSSPEEYEAFSLNDTLSYTYPLEDTYFTRFVLVIPIYLLALVMVVPPFYLTVINTVLLAMFKALNSTMASNRESKQDSLQRVEVFRHFHLKLCSIISNFDNDLQYFYGNIFFWTLCQGILDLFILMKYEHGSLVILTLLHMMTLSIVVLLVMAISAALVHEAAHAPLESIYYINVDTISIEKATQLNLFLSKLTGTQVGFTTFGLLTITKEFILTIAGVFLTYFAVLYTSL